MINMSNTFKEFKKYLQLLTPCEQIIESNQMMHNNADDNTNKKYRMIKELNIIKK